MVEILKSFESVAGWLHPLVLVVPGVAMVALGLVAWLAGLWLRRVVLALVGIVAGLLVGFFLGVPEPGLLALAAAGGALFGAVLPQLAVAVLLGVFSMAALFGVLARAHPIPDPDTLIVAENLDSGAARAPLRESVDVVRAYAIDLLDRVVAVGRQLAPEQWAVLASVGSGALTLGLLFRRMADALACSALGTALIFAGLVALLMCKGSAPVAHVEARGALYGLVLVGMILFGTVEQLCLCQPPQQETRKKGSPARAGKKQARGSWRNR